MASVNPEIYELKRQVAHNTQNAKVEEGQNNCNGDGGASCPWRFWILLADTPALGLGNTAGFRAGFCDFPVHLDPSSGCFFFTFNLLGHIWSQLWRTCLLGSQSSFSVCFLPEENWSSKGGFKSWTAVNIFSPDAWFLWLYSSLRNLISFLSIWFWSASCAHSYTHRFFSRHDSLLIGTYWAWQGSHALSLSQGHFDLLIPAARPMGKPALWTLQLSRQRGKRQSAKNVAKLSRQVAKCARASSPTWKWEHFCSHFIG